MSKNRLIIISGPSGVGKNTAIDHLTKIYSVSFVVPLTTRPPRFGERDGVDYKFLATQEFQSKIASDEIKHWDYALNNYYGFDCAIAKGGIYITHALSRMALRIKKARKNVVLVFLRAIDDEINIQRLRMRCSSHSEFENRVNHMKEEILHSALFDHVLTGFGGEDVASSKYDDLWRELGL